MEYRSHYRNRPVLNIKDYKAQKNTESRKGCGCRISIGGLALLAALHFGVRKYKMNDSIDNLLKEQELKFEHAIKNNYRVESVEREFYWYERLVNTLDSLNKPVTNKVEQYRKMYTDYKNEPR